MANVGLGTTFERWSGAVWVAIGEINKIDGPALSRTDIDTTSLDTVGGYMTSIAGLRDPGSLTLDMNFTKATYEIMLGDFEVDVSKSYRMILTDTDTSTFLLTGYVNALTMAGIAPNEKVSANVTIRLTGAISFESGV